MTLVGRKVVIQLHHPDVEEKLPKIEGEIVKVVEAKKFKLFSCIIKLSHPFERNNFSEKSAKEIAISPEYAILSSEKDNFEELITTKNMNFGFDLVINERILKTNPENWERKDFKTYSFAETSLIL